MVIESGILSMKIVKHSLMCDDEIKYTGKRIGI